MGCISCKAVDPTEGKNLAGKARLPGIPVKAKKKLVLKRKKILGEINVVDINKEKVKILQQLEEENIIAKKASGGVAYFFGDDDNKEEKAKPKLPPQRLMERLERPSTSHGFNSEEKEIMAECLKNESLQEKGRLAKISEERRFIAEMNREKAIKIKALELEWKLKQREKKQEELKKQKEQENLDISCRNHEKQQKAKCRRFNLERARDKTIEDLRKMDNMQTNNSNLERARDKTIEDLKKMDKMQINSSSGMPDVDV